MTRRSLLALPLAGCGRPTQPGKVRIATLNSLGHLPATLAQLHGHFEAEGVSVNMDTFSSTSKTMEALIGGSVDVITTTYEQILQLRVKGQDVRMFLVLTVREGRAIVTLRPEIRSLRDLKGKRLGVPSPGSSNHSYAKVAMHRSGLRPEDVSVAGIGIGRAAIAALERGIVDAAAVATGTFFHLQAKHPRLILLSDATTPQGSREVWGAESLPLVGLVARPKWLEQHPDQARKVATAVRKSTSWLRDQPLEQIMARVPKEFLVVEDREVNLLAFRSMKPAWSKDGIVPPDGAESVRQSLALIDEGIRNGPIDLSKTYTNEFVVDPK